MCWFGVRSWDSCGVLGSMDSVFAGQFRLLKVFMVQIRSLESRVGVWGFMGAGVRFRARKEAQVIFLFYINSWTDFSFLVTTAPPTIITTRRDSGPNGKFCALLEAAQQCKFKFTVFQFPFILQVKHAAFGVFSASLLHLVMGISITRAPSVEMTARSASCLLRLRVSAWAYFRALG